MAEQKNEKIKSALDEIGVLTGDEEIQRMAELRDKWEMDWNSSISYAKRQGKEEGKKKAKLETAKKMLEENIPIQVIIKVTGLDEKEILDLKA